MVVVGGIVVYRLRYNNKKKKRIKRSNGLRGNWFKEGMGRAAASRHSTIVHRWI